jgi:hypothetical protein
MTSICRFGQWLSLPLVVVASISAQRPRDPTLPLILPPTSPTRSVVCGLTIFSGGTAVDPKMPKSPPPGNFTLHVATPTICRDLSHLPALKDLKDLPNRLPMFLGPKR